MAKSGTKLIAAGIFGLAVGVAVGVMFAPCKGSKTRKKIKKSIRTLTDEMGGSLSDKFETIKSIFSGTGDKVEETPAGDDRT